MSASDSAVVEKEEEIVDTTASGDKSTILVSGEGVENVEVFDAKKLKKEEYKVME